MNKQLQLPTFLYQQDTAVTRYAFVTAVLETLKQVNRRLRRTEGIQRPTPELSRGYAELVARHHQLR